MRARRLLFAVILCLLLSGVQQAAQTASAQDSNTSAPLPTVNIEFVLDSSGSMADVTDRGEIRMDAAKNVLTDVINSIPNQSGRINVGFRIYGNKGDNSEATKDVSCQSSDLLVKVNGVNQKALTKAVQSAQPTGWTPIARSLTLAAKDFPKSEGTVINTVVLVTDGVETCGGDPAKEASKLHSQKGLRMVTHVIGLATSPDDQQVLSAIAKNGGGRLFGAANGTELRSALFSILEDLQIVVGAGYIGGNAFTLLPQGKLGQLSIIAHGTVNATTHELPFVLRNNTGSDIVGPKVSVTIRDGAGALLGAGDALRISPFYVRAGGVAFGYIFLGMDASFPPDATYSFKVASTPIKEAQYHSQADLDIVEASLFADRIAGTVKNNYKSAVKGPFGFSALCLDQNGGVLSSPNGFSDVSEIAPAETQSFQVDLFLENYSGAGCPLFLVTGQGFGKPPPAHRHIPRADSKGNGHAEPRDSYSEFAGEPASVPTGQVRQRLHNIARCRTRCAGTKEGGIADR